MYTFSKRFLVCFDCYKKQEKWNKAKRWQRHKTAIFTTICAALCKLLWCLFVCQELTSLQHENVVSLLECKVCNSYYYYYYYYYCCIVTSCNNESWYCFQRVCVTCVHVYVYVKKSKSDPGDIYCRVDHHVRGSSILAGFIGLFQRVSRMHGIAAGVIQVQPCYCCFSLCGINLWLGKTLQSFLHCYLRVVLLCWHDLCSVAA